MSLLWLAIDYDLRTVGRMVLMSWLPVKGKRVSIAAELDWIGGRERGFRHTRLIDMTQHLSVN